MGFLSIISVHVLDYHVVLFCSLFTYQMKQSLEKLHSGIGVPELQQDPDDPLTETQTEA